MGNRFLGEIVWGHRVDESSFEEMGRGSFDDLNSWLDRVSADEVPLPDSTLMYPVRAFYDGVEFVYDDGEDGPALVEVGKGLESYIFLD